MTTIQMESVETIQMKTEQRSKEVWSWIRFFGILLLVFVVMRFGFAISFISGGSMEPTYHDGSIVLTSNILYTPEFQDIVVFSDQNGFHVIKRVIGTPGDTVEIKEGIVFLNGTALTEEYTKGISDSMPLQTIPSDFYFLIGDHRTPGESYDSRSAEIGAVSKELINGEVILSINPFNIGN